MKWFQSKKIINVGIQEWAATRATGVEELISQKWSRTCPGHISKSKERNILHREN